MTSRRPKIPLVASFGCQSGFCATYELLSASSSPTMVSATMRPPTGPSLRVLIVLLPLVVLMTASVSMVSARMYVHSGQFSWNAGWIVSIESRRCLLGRL